MRPFCHLPRTKQLSWPRSLSFIFAFSLAVIGGDALADQLVEVTAYALNVRAAPSASAPIVGLVNKHDRLVVRSVSDNWAAVLHGTWIRLRARSGAGPMTKEAHSDCEIGTLPTSE
jgi:hypothetical protein